MKKIKRAVHFDFHTMPGVRNFLKDFTPAEFAQRLADCNVDYINMFARCNLGFSYYPTKIGTVYPGLETNLLGDIIEQCHLRDIGVSAYINGGLNHQLMIDNPGIMKINKDGTVYKADRINNNFFRAPCFNTSYRTHLINEIKEVLELEPDGIFCDCLIPAVCYCPECIKKMKSLGINIDDDDMVTKFAYDTIHEVFAEIRAVVPDDKRLILNSHPCDDISQYNSHIEAECLATDSEWGYDYFHTMAPYYRHFGNDHLYMNGRFVDSWGDFGGVKSKEALENDVYDALLYGYVPSIGDHLHPRYGLDDGLYKNVKDIYSFVKSLEPWTDDGKQLVDAGILRNKIDHTNMRNFVTDSDKGAARMMAELKVSYDVINEDMDFSKYKLLILPENTKLTPHLLEKLSLFEGSILSVGNSICKNDLWDYIESFEADTGTHAFFRFDNNVRGAYCPGIKMKSKYSISDRVEPCFNKEFDWLHSYYYVPYDEYAGYSAVAVFKNKAHISFNIFEAYIQKGAWFHKALVAEILKTLLPCRLIETDLPSTARATLIRSKAGDVIHIKSTFPEHRQGIGVVENHVVLPSGSQVVIDGIYNSVGSLPDMSFVHSRTEDKKTIITLPQINGYGAFLLK